MNNMKKNSFVAFLNKENVRTAIALILSLILLIAYYDHVFTKRGGDNGSLMFEHNTYDSYTLQAMKWREGQIAIIESDVENYQEEVNKYAYLELAIYEDNYYLSFPPVPAIPMLFLSFIFGSNTPSNFVSFMYGLGTFVFIFLLAKRFNLKNDSSLILAMFVTVGSSLFNLTLSGSVWFMAQSLAMCLTAAAFYCVFSKPKWCWYLSMFLLALAVGCRPFQVLYFPLLIYIIFKKYNFKILRTWTYFISPAVVAFCYMVYNYIRFDSIFEFGHNYLPEFATQKEDGQFALSYIKSNVDALIKEMPKVTSNGLEYSKFGFCFYISSVIFILFAAAVVYRLVRDSYTAIRTNRKFDVDCDRIGASIILVAIAIHIFLVLLHGSQGAYQFGARYMVDCVPACALGVLLCGRSFLERFKIPAAMLCIFGILLNYIGSLSVIV